MTLDTRHSASDGSKRGPALVWLRALLFPLRIRQKLILLHTTFSLALAAILLLSIRPAIHDIVSATEAARCALAVQLLRSAPARAQRDAGDGLALATGAAAELRLDAQIASRAHAAPGEVVMSRTDAGWPVAVLWDGARGEFLTAALRSPAARRSVLRLYGLVALVLLAVYGLIALTVEVFVLPQHVYGPIRRLQQADRAAQEGDASEAIIPECDIPSDELGQIMRSRNAVIARFRAQERELALALQELERIAADLKVKNHLLEHAKRNLPEQERLAALGMMSAGVAHELNTPLAVLKGVAEQIARAPEKGVPSAQAQLMLRVVGRLERLSASLLDFARAGPAGVDTVDVAKLIAESWTLVRLDRGADRVELRADVESGLTASGDEDRLVQVFVNLLRNAVDAMRGVGSIDVVARRSRRDDGSWVVVTVSDTGPGIDPELLPRLFEPFVTTRLDARGTGLGLAVAEGVLRRHGGVIAVRNRRGGGAEFEVVIPAHADVASADEAGGRARGQTMRSGA